MPPIPIYTDAPITAAAKADGVTPQTAPPPTRTTQEQPVTTTSTTSTNAYPPARPGAAAVPGPTPSIPRPQPPPTTTTTSATNGPPPPQPGAVPMAPHPSNNPTAHPAAPSTSMPLPPQLSIPTPNTNAAPTSSTATAVPPRQLPAAHRLSLSTHPPGYQQDQYASELSAAQRASLEASEARDRPQRNSISGILGGDDGDGFGNPSSPSGRAWGAVKGALGSAGQGLAKWEEGVWKKFG